MTYNKKEKNITQTNLLRTNTIYFHLRVCRVFRPSSWSWPEPPSSSPPPLARSYWGWSSQLWFLPHSKKWRKTLPVVRLAPHKLIVSVDAVVGVELLATTLAIKQIATMLPNFVLANHLKRLESFVTDITGVNPLPLLCFVPPHWSRPATTWFSSQTCPPHLQVQWPADEDNVLEIM